MTNREIISYVMKAHGDQQYSDMPYIVHLAMVAGFFYDRERQAIALLHDILEDTDVTKDELQKLFWSHFKKSELNHTFVSLIGASYLRQNKELLVR